MNQLRMTEESDKFTSEYNKTQEILAYRYEQEIRKAISNIREEVDKAESPYLGENDLVITTIDLR